MKNDQLFILLMMAFALISTILLYCYEAKKNVEYKNDERWQLVLLKAKKIAHHMNILLLIVAVYTCYMIDKNISISLTRLSCLCLIYLGINNFLELMGVFYYNKRL